MFEYLEVIQKNGVIARNEGDEKHFKQFLSGFLLKNTQKS